MLFISEKKRLIGHEAEEDWNFDSGLQAGFRVADDWDLSDGLSKAETFARLEHRANDGGLKLFIEGSAGMDQWGAQGGLKWTW